jgi:SAM-dependent methyltransferase
MNTGLSKYWMALHNTERLALHATIYTWAAGQTPPGRVLDLGCEYGFGSLLIAETNPTLQVLGLDLDLTAIRYTQNIPSEDRIPRVNADASKLPIASESFSGVYLINLLHMVEDPCSVLSEVRRALMVGGVAIISIPREDPGEVEYCRSRFIRDLESEIHTLFSHVIYPYEICGQIPSFPARSFLVNQQVSSWIALCRKYELVKKSNGI